MRQMNSRNRRDERNVGTEQMRKIRKLSRMIHTHFKNTKFSLISMTYACYRMRKTYVLALL